MKVELAVGTGIVILGHLVISGLGVSRCRFATPSPAPACRCVRVSDNTPPVSPCPDDVPQGSYQALKDALTNALSANGGVVAGIDANVKQVLLANQVAPKTGRYRNRASSRSSNSGTNTGSNNGDFAQYRGRDPVEDSAELEGEADDIFDRNAAWTYPPHTVSTPSRCPSSKSKYSVRRT